MDIDPTKAPRAYAAWKKAYDVQELAKFMVELSQQLEVELNTAIVNEAFAENKVYMLEKQLKQANEHLNGSNKIIRQQQLLDEENLMLKNRTKRLEEMYEGEIGECPEFLGSNLKGLLIRELNLANNRIKQLEKALEATAMIIGPPGHSEWATDDEINHAWGLYIQTKEAKL